LASATRGFCPAFLSRRELSGPPAQQLHEIQRPGKLVDAPARLRHPVEIGIDAKVLAHRQPVRQVDVG